MAYLHICLQNVPGWQLWSHTQIYKLLYAMLELHIEAGCKIRLQDWKDKDGGCEVTSGKVWPLLHTHAGCRTKCHGLAVKNCGRGDMAPVLHTQTHPADPPQDYLLPTHHKYHFILLMKISPLSLIAWPNLAATSLFSTPACSNCHLRPETLTGCSKIWVTSFPKHAALSYLQN